MSYHPRQLLSSLVAVAFIGGCGAAQPSGPAKQPVATSTTAKAPQHRYPAAKRGDVVDDYHGTKVADPYRWLEDPDSAETRRWVEAQNKLFNGFVGKLPYRAGIHARLSELWNYERFSAPTPKKGAYFFSKNNGLQNQNVLYRAKSADAPGAVILDPNTLSKDGTVALKGGYLSEDGRYMAWQTAASGSDWTEIRVRDLQTGEDLKDHVKWVKFSRATWRKDGSGFYYSRYDAPKPGQALKAANYFQKLYFHRLGTEQSEDQLIYERPDHKDWGFSATVSDDDRWLIISVWRGASARNQVFVQRLTAPKSKRRRGKKRKTKRKTKVASGVQPLIEGFHQEYDFLGSRGDELWFKTDLNAPRGRVIRVDANKPDPKHWKEVIPQAAETLHRAQWIGGRLICTYLKDAHSEVKLFDVDGRPDPKTPQLKLPTLGTVGGFTGGPEASETFYAFTSFTYPTTIFRYDFASGASTVWRAPKVAFNPNDYETTQSFVPSKDGTKVPVYVVRRKDLKRDGERPVYLYAYGGFNISLTPTFRVARLQWLEMGGVYVLANLRGGGEYGDKWHKAGMREKKQNVFDDFAAVAQWLVLERWTRPSRLAIGGGSNGGLLVGASITQRPELFGAALAAVGVMDMLRFHKWTIGWAWVPEYGSSAKPDAFKWLHAYSPYHNARPAKYPATLITTADHDDRVVPAHSFKFTAALQHAQKGAAPVMSRIETKAGHGAGKPTSKRIAEAADRWTFLVQALGEAAFDLPKGSAAKKASPKATSEKSKR